jgi:hypothetical protein
MQALWIDIGGLAVFFGYIAFVYWHASRQPKTAGGRLKAQRPAWRRLEDR